MTDHPDVDAGEIGQAGMRKLLEDCEEFPWQEAVERAVSTLAHPARFLEEAVSPCRASWWPLTSLQAHWRVLDFGCGWGAMTFGLAPHVASVLACDLNLDRLRFARARALQDGVENVGLVCAGDTPRLPFADHEFHAILFHGSLARSHTGSASMLESFLREAARLLAPDGQVWLWVPNRWSWRRWRGEGTNGPERAGISLFTGLATRAGKPHLAGSHSLWGYKQLLRSAGFPQDKTWVPLPDLDSFHAIADPSARRATELYFADRGDAPHTTFYLKAKSALTPLLSPGFLCIASRGDRQTSFLDQLGRHIGDRL
ncbi:MAG TPA: class I SAM-dependent methyltransferase, partial [Candidatus Acidoferrales bacterium]|nr:class I SAM-dependent methyltransferase [Candidatus Acidoferrales bacterium]